MTENNHSRVTIANAYRNINNNAVTAQKKKETDQFAIRFFASRLYLNACCRVTIFIQTEKYIRTHCTPGGDDSPDVATSSWFITI